MDVAMRTSLTFRHKESGYCYYGQIVADSDYRGRFVLVYYDWQSLKWESAPLELFEVA